MSSANSIALQDYLNETRVPQAFVVLIICPVISLSCVSLRLYTRAFLLKRVFWEDYIMVMAMVTSILMSVFMVLAFSNGSGRHIEAITPEQITFQSRISPGVHLDYIASHMFLKLSIILHYTRISVMAFERRLCYVIMGVLLAGYLAYLSTSLARCIPFQAIWIPNIPGATCVNTTILFLVGQSWSLAMDIVILVAPLFILRHLSIPWKQRALLVIVVGFGGIACIISILRLQVLRLSTTSPDKTWDSYFSAIYAAIEVNLGIFCACIVTLRPLFRRWRWLAGGDAEKPPVELEQPKLRRRVIDKDHIPTIDSTQVATISDDVELESEENKAAGCSDSSRELISTSSVMVDGDDSSAESTTAVSRSSEGQRESDMKGSFSKVLPK